MLVDGQMEFGRIRNRVYLFKKSEDAHKLAKYVREHLFGNARVMVPIEAENKASARNAPVFTRIVPFSPSELIDLPKFIWLAKSGTPKTMLHFFTPKNNL